MENARLIAAAPELLEALNYALEVLEIGFNPGEEQTVEISRATLCNAANKARSAIAKATAG